MFPLKWMCRVEIASLFFKHCVLLFIRNLVRPRASWSELSVNTTRRVPYNILTIYPNMKTNKMRQKYYNGDHSLKCPLHINYDDFHAIHSKLQSSLISLKLCHDSSWHVINIVHGLFIGNKSVR